MWDYLVISGFINGNILTVNYLKKSLILVCFFVVKLSRLISRREVLRGCTLTFTPCCSWYFSSSSVSAISPGMCYWSLLWFWCGLLFWLAEHCFHLVNHPARYLSLFDSWLLGTHCLSSTTPGQSSSGLLWADACRLHHCQLLSLLLCSPPIPAHLHLLRCLMGCQVPSPSIPWLIYASCCSRLVPAGRRHP